MHPENLKSCSKSMDGASTLRPSIHHYLEDLIKKKRDEAYMFETLLRELPPLSQEADRALWELCVANSAFRS